LKGALNVVSLRLSLRSVATVVVVVASVWFALAVSWGVFGHTPGSHAAVVSAHGIAAENMLTWGVWGPVSEYSVARPTPQLYDTAHPWGTLWAVRWLMKVFGRHAYLPRLEAVLMSIATPPLLYAIGRALWGPVPGALSALAYVVVPVALAFGDSPGFEVALVFGCLLTTWGYIRLTARWKRRWLAVSLLGVVWTANAEWEGSVFLGVVLSFFLVAQYLLPRWFGRGSARRFGQWWAFSTAVVVITLVGYAGYFVHIDAVDRILSQLAVREKLIPFSHVLQHRSYWSSLAFTPVVIAVGTLALPVFLFRLVLLRQTREIFPLALLATAAATHVHFPTDGDASFFVPLSYAAYWALSLGVLAATWVNLGRWVLRRLGRRDPDEVLPIGAFVGLGIAALLVLPDGLRGLAFGRRAGGVFDGGGHGSFVDRDKTTALEWMGDRMKPATRVQFHTSMHRTAADDWALHRPVVGVDGPPSRVPRADDRYFIGNLDFMPAADQGALAAQFHMVAVGPFVVVDRTGPNAPADGYSFDSRSPNAIEWYFVSSDPIVTVRADPWYTWELREQFGQVPNAAPTVAPLAPEELRIAHNMAVAMGDAVRADAYEAKLVEKLLIYPALTFTDGTRLLGERITPDVAPTLEVYFAAAGPSNADVQFEVESSVRKRSRLSLVPPDETVSVLGPSFAVPPKLWKRGFIYVSRSEVRPRPGSENIAGYFTGPDRAHVPKPRDGSAKVRLLTLE
jgi:hypothetical protein